MHLGGESVSDPFVPTGTREVKPDRVRRRASSPTVSADTRAKADRIKIKPDRVRRRASSPTVTADTRAKALFY